MFGYFVIGFGVLAIVYIIAGYFGYRRDTIKTYGIDFWKRSGK